MTSHTDIPYGVDHSSQVISEMGEVSGNPQPGVIGISEAEDIRIVCDATIAEPMVDVVIPVYNEEKDLVGCVKKLIAFLSVSFPYSYRITIADNASTDATVSVAVSLAQQFPAAVRVIHMPRKGRGRALKAVWMRTDAVIAAYMDVDLSTDLNGFLPLLAPLITGHSDVAIGSRLQASSRVVRGVKREYISRCYNIFLRTCMRAQFSDAQCGFKAIRCEVARAILPYVYDTGWFFDTELLVLSEKVGLRITEVAVDWVDDPHSKVDIVSTALADIRGCARMAQTLMRGDIPIAQLRTTYGRDPFIPSRLFTHLLRFALVGVISTILNVVLFVALRHYCSNQVANFTALTLSAVFNVIANRAFTFGVRGRQQAGKHYAQGFIVFGFTAALTAGALSLLASINPHASTALEVVVLLLANLIATVVRFIAFRWIFHIRTTH